MKKWKRFFYNIKIIQETVGLHRIAAIAAGTAFWLFLSLVPIVILAVSVLPYTSLTEAQLMGAVARVVPESFTELIELIVADVYRSSLAILSVSLLTTVWSAAKGFTSLIRGLEEIGQPRDRSNYLMRRLRGMLYTVAMLLFMVLSIVLGGFGRYLMMLAERFFPVTAELFAFLMRFRSLVIVAVLTVFFTGIYRWGTGPRMPLRSALPGGVFAAVAWTLLTWVFSAWVSRGGYGAYGSLATVAVVMLWLYYGQCVVLLGACLNRALTLDLRDMLTRDGGSAE